MPKLLRFASLLTAALATAGTACVTDVIVDDGIGAAVKVGLDDDFALAAQRHGVPVDVLKAVSYVETRWQHIASDGEHEGQAGAWGVMALGGNRLPLGPDRHEQPQHRRQHQHSAPPTPRRTEQP